MTSGDAGSDGYRIKAMLDLAVRLCHVLSNRMDVAGDLLAELLSALKQVDVFSVKATSTTAAVQLDKLGCAMWNASTHLDRDTISRGRGDPGTTLTTFVATLRSFAFSLLAAAAIPSTSKDKDGHDLRLFKVALKATQSALLDNDADLALRLLERCSYLAGDTDKHNSIMLVDNTDDNDYSPTSQRRSLVQTYHLLRIEHAKIINNADLAEHFVQKLDYQLFKHTPELTEHAASLFHDLAITLDTTDQHETSRTWLMRTLDLINACSDGHLQQRVQDLRISTTTRLAQRLLDLKDERATQAAWTMASELSTDHGLDGCLSVTLLELDVLLAFDPLRRDLLGQTSMRLTSNDINDETFRVISRAITKIIHRDRDCAEQTLRRLTQRQLLSFETAIDATECQARLETCVVTYAHFITSDSGTTTCRSSALTSLLDSVYENLHAPLSTAATHAIQSLLWRKIINEASTVTLAWLNLLQHGLLSNCSDANKARIQRKTMLIHMAMGNLTAARRIFFEMSTRGQGEVLSQYIAFKIAIHSDDHEWAATCLQNIARQAGEDQTLLHACALEAQRTSNQAFAVEALQTLVDSTPLTRLTPCLLRCLARLQISELDVQKHPEEATFTKITRLFDRFVECLDSQSHSSSTQWQDECRWWSRHAYNLSLRCVNPAVIDHLVSLLKACVHIMSHMLATENPREHENTRTKIRTCHFILATTLITNAREQKQDEDTLQSYVVARQHIDQYFKLSTPAPSGDQAQQAFQMRRYELEAIIKLKHWQDLQPTIAQCLAFDADNQWDRLADLALILHQELLARADYSTHAPDVLELLQRSLNEMWKREKNIKQVARWLRTTFSIDNMVNQEVHGDSQVALKLLDQAAALASRGAQGLTDRYPDEELQWLASASFNRGVDYGIGGQEPLAWQLFDAALELARYADDNGALHASLTARRAEASKKMQQHR